MIKILELFGGIGAPRKALINLGVEHKSIDYVEFNEKAVRSYNAMFDNRYAPQDVRGYDLRPDILVHGSPCQDFSALGKEYGGNIGDGTRSSLMHETITIIANLGIWKPKVVLWENVPRSLSPKHRQAFNRYLDDLGSLGYTHSYQVLESLDYGLPQDRKRLIVVSTLVSEPFNFDLVEKVERQNIWDFVNDTYEDRHLVTQPSMLARIETKAQSNFNGVISIIKDYCWTITTKQMRCPNAGVVDLGNGQYRYLTERECWRLMGFDDSDYEAALKEHPGIKNKLNGTLYHQAGNSIDVNLLMAVFKVILDCDYLR